VKGRAGKVEKTTAKVEATARVEKMTARVEKLTARAEKLTARAEKKTARAEKKTARAEKMTARAEKKTAKVEKVAARIVTVFGFVGWEWRWKGLVSGSLTGEELCGIPSVVVEVGAWGNGPAGIQRAGWIALPVLRWHNPFGKRTSSTSLSLQLLPYSTFEPAHTAPFDSNPSPLPRPVAPLSVSLFCARGPLSFAFFSSLHSPSLRPASWRFPTGPRIHRARPGAVRPDRHRRGDRAALGEFHSG